MNAQEVLLAAADLLERDGWCQGALLKDGKHCAWGAILVCGGYSAPETNLAMDRLYKVIDSYSISLWNDRRKQTAEEVISALRAAAA